MGFLSRLFGTAPPSGTQEPRYLASGRGLDVVGESFYSDNINHVRARLGVSPGDTAETVCVLVCEPNNPHSKTGKAVGVYLFGKCVGHIPSTQCEQVFDLLRPHGNKASVDCTVFFDDSGSDRPMNSVNLQASFPARFADEAPVEKPVSSKQVRDNDLLASRKVSFSRFDLENCAQSSGGEYLHKVAGSDQQNLNAFISNMSDRERWEGVAFLELEPGGSVSISIDGQVIDHLTENAASLIEGKLTEPMPVKCRVEKIVGRSKTWGHVSLLGGKS